MRPVWVNVCAGCCRACSFLTPAPGTPAGQESRNLYCPACRAKGWAVYGPRQGPGPSNVDIGIGCGCLLVLLVAFGFMVFALGW